MPESKSTSQYSKGMVNVTILVRKEHVERAKILARHQKKYHRYKYHTYKSVFCAAIRNALEEQEGIMRDQIQDQIDPQED